jgi:hypothetical protein
MVMACMVLIKMLADLAKCCLQTEASHILSVCEDPNTESVSLLYVSILVFKVGHA